jgi:hypothetical protein
MDAEGNLTAEVTGADFRGSYSWRAKPIEPMSFHMGARMTGSWQRQPRSWAFRSAKWKRDPQAPGIMGPKSKAAAQSHRAAKTQKYGIDYSISQLPAPARRLYGGSDKWLYVDPEYQEVYPS